MNLIKKTRLNYLLVIACFGLLFLLLLKNPYSTRNLIPNLEPYPDTIHYLSPAINLAHGEGFYIEREGRVKNPSVPFLYSFVILPAFLFTSDPRSFYFINILMSLFGLFLLYKISMKLSKNIFITTLVMFFYATNYFIYWYPNLAMAENLLLLLFLLAVWMLLEKVSLKNLIISAGLVVGFYATKYAAAPLSASLLILYLAKIFFETEKYKYKLTAYFIIISTILFSLFTLFEYSTKEVSIFSSLQRVLGLLFDSLETTASETVALSPWFSLRYLPQNFTTYFKSFFGIPMRFLWDNTPLVPGYVGILGLGGLIFGLVYKTTRLVSVSLLLFLFSQILFISTFYSTDGRYIYHAIPALIIGFVLFLKSLYDLFKSKTSKLWIFYLILSAFFVIYLLSSALRIKNQISLNLRHTETPWYYISVIEANKYFDSLPVKDKKPILISALPPYYVDYFSENKYTLLPLSKEQEFLNEMSLVWGPQDFTDLNLLYKNYLNQGYEVFISKYGLGNEVYLHRDFDKINSEFDLEKVYEACLNACDIYKLHLKNEK